MGMRAGIDGEDVMPAISMGITVRTQYGQTTPSGGGGGGRRFGDQCRGGGVIAVVNNCRIEW